MNKKLKIIIPILIIILILLIVIKKFKQRKSGISKIPTAELPVYTVKGVKIKKGELVLYKKYLGYLKPDNSINVSSRFSGIIEKVYIAEAERVKKGQLLVKIDDRDIKLQIQNLQNNIESLNETKKALLSQLQGAQATLEYQRNKFYRDKKLFLGKAISKESFEFSKSNYLKAKAAVNSIKSSIKSIDEKVKSLKSQIKIQKHNLLYTKIYSPIDGVVAKKILHKGDLVTPGKPIINIQTIRHYKVLVEIPEKDTKNINVGSQAIVNLYGKKVISRISKFYPKAENNSLLIAEIVVENLPDKKIPTNAFVDVKIKTGVAKGYIVPVNSILSLTNGKFILTLKDNKFTKIPVKVKAENERYAIIKGKFTEGMPVAVAMENKLRLLAMGKKGRIFLGANNEE